MNASKTSWKSHKTVWTKTSKKLAHIKSSTNKQLKQEKELSNNRVQTANIWVLIEKELTQSNLVIYIFTYSLILLFHSYVNFIIIYFHTSIWACLGVSVLNRLHFSHFIYFIWRFIFDIFCLIFYSIWNYLYDNSICNYLYDNLIWSFIFYLIFDIFCLIIWFNLFIN